MLSSRDQGLGRVEPGELVEQLGPRDPGQREPAGRELDPGQAELAPDLDDRRQVVGRLRVEQRLVGQRARRDDPDDLALDQPLGELRDPRPARRPPRAGRPGPAWPGTIRRAGWGNPAIGTASAPLSRRRQGQPEQRRGPLGVLAEHLVEIAHPEQEQGIGIAGLQLAILLHHRGCGGIAHRDVGKKRRTGNPSGRDPSARIGIYGVASRPG